MIHLPIVRMFFSVVLAAAAFHVAADSAPEYFEAAIDRFNNKEYRKSVILLKNALREDPQHLPSRILLGKSLIHTGDVAGAEKDLKIALEYGADESLVVTLLGSAYLIQGKYEQLLSEIRSGGRSTEVEMQILVLRAYAQVQLGDLSQAEQYLTRARRLMPDNPEPMLGLATVAIRQGDLEKAEQFISLAQQHQPDESEILFAQGEILRLRGDPERAIALFDRSIELVPEKIQARLSRAALLVNRGQEAAAQADIDYILIYSPNNLQARYLNALLMARAGKHQQAYDELQLISQTLSTLRTGFINSHGPTMLLLGTLDYLQNNLDKAKSRLQRYIKLHPHHLQPHLLLAEIQIRMGDNIGAIVTLKPMMKEHGQNVDLLLLTGTAYLNDKQYTEASEYLDRAASLKPDAARIRTRLALSKLGSGNRDAAIQELESVLSLEGDHARPGLLLANIQLRKGEYDDALKTLALLRREMPGNPLVYNLAGVAYLNKKELDSAHAAFSRAIEASPNFLPARLNLAAIETARKRYDLAIAQFDQVLRQAPEDLRAMEGMAKVAELQNRPMEAISWMEKIRNRASASAPPAVLGRLAELYLRTGQPGLALEVAIELANQIPGELQALELQGRAQLALGNREAAARLFRIMQQSQPDSAAMLQRIAALLMQAGDLQNAEKAVQQALQKEPGLLTARGTQVVLEQRLGKQEQALVHARQIRDDRPELSLGYRLIGDSLMASGDFRGAAEAYASGLKVEPDNTLLMLQFRAEYAAGNGKVPWSILHGWLETHPRDDRIHDVLGSLYNRAGDLEKARFHFEKVVELRPGHGAAYNNLAMVYSRLSSPLALETARRAYALEPNDPAINDTLGWLLVQSNEFQQGLEYLRQAQARSSENPEVRYHLGVALAGLQRNREAVQELQTAIAQSGGEFADYQAARDLLRRLDQDSGAGVKE